VHAEREIGPLPGVTTNGLGGERWGTAMAKLGDVDGDGIADLAVGAPGTQIQFTTPKVWTLLLDASGGVKSVANVFTGSLGDYTGSSLEALGDFDGDGVPDLVEGSSFGSVRIHLLQSDGTAHTTLPLDPPPRPAGTSTVSWGSSIASLGDLDGDGTVDLAIGAPRDFTTVQVAQCTFGGPPAIGSVWITFLNPDGSVKDTAVIDATTPALAGELETFDWFGIALEGLGDRDGDGTVELAVGASGDDDGGEDRGALWILSLDSTGGVQRTQKISSTRGGFLGPLEDGDSLSGVCGGGYFGSLADVGDLDGDGIGDLAVGAPGDDEGGADLGAVWLLFLHPDGSVRGYQKIGATDGGLTIPLTIFNGAGIRFGHEVLNMGDLDGDGLPELLVGAAFGPSSFVPNGVVPFGAIYALSLGPGPLASVAFRNAGTNPDSYASGLVRIGETWTSTIDVAMSGHQDALLFGFEAPGELALGGGQTLLAIDTGSGAQLDSGFHPGPIATIHIPIPNVTSLLGLRLSTQALHAGGTTPFALSNAQDILVGLGD